MVGPLMANTGLNGGILDDAAGAAPGGLAAAEGAIAQGSGGGGLPLADNLGLDIAQRQ
ncbi:hypothetical protein [Mycolicibacterium frederiksbergense]|uniref:hypothetical protein n=1 Tax=Mycolicibacterium frederiksbergense TaxID=117567 RepID=UPI00265BC587|nr:hypothetical protein [Mycolicibacterium frederiksbergense]MDO0975771.1 hypothetical protein [Mycolicibacterium frederiksbergense]